MSIISRFQNALKTGGLKEVSRKLFWKTVYINHGRKTFRYVTDTPLEYGLNTTEQRKQKIIVSMTSFSRRLPTIHKCLKSLLLQDVKPDEIIVYFGSDVERSMLPEEMLALEPYGVTYRFDPSQNLRSYKKFFYAMQEYPDDIVITVDDDVYYPRYWLRSFLDVHRKYPECVCAWRLHKMRAANGVLLPYNQWYDQYRKSDIPGFDLFPTGVGGILYPPHCLDQRVFDKEKFQKLCFTCDDIWLKIMCILHGTKTVWVPNREIAFWEVEKKQSYALSDDNVGDGKNDAVLAAVMKEFGIADSDFFWN